MLSTKALSALVRELGQVVRAHVAAAIGTVAPRLNDLESRVAAIPAGPQGERGERGDPGPPGESIKGDPGERGPDGRSAYEVAVSLGYDGDVYAWMDSLKGADGKDGQSTKGDPGAPGEPGPAGPAGADGPQGEPGPVGPIGPRGEAGPMGPAGPHGEPGLPGTAGTDGRDGAPGKSAYEVALERGYVGTELQWLESLKGRDGRDGRDGLPGPRGDRGEKGDPGTPGRDALALDILPAIDPARAYARGTFARHRGGLWRAHADTEGMQAWECVVDGVADIIITLDGERGIVVTVERSSGQRAETRAVLPLLIYRDVYRPGTDYQRGDAVTWGGSLWHCNAPTTEKPGESDAWTLAAKRGRDGRDGAPGIRGERGPEGRSGRDLTQLGFDGSKY